MQHTYVATCTYMHIAVVLRNCSIAGDVKCRDNGSCIHSDMICNGISDCMDGSDEEKCSKNLICLIVCTYIKELY